jgi:hypothetical protein
LSRHHASSAAVKMNKVPQDRQAVSTTTGRPSRARAACRAMCRQALHRIGSDQPSAAPVLAHHSLSDVSAGNEKD